MSEVPVRIFDIGHAQNVQLLLATAASGIDREQDGPGDNASGKRHDDQDLEEPEPKVSVKRVVPEHMAVGKSRVVFDQAEKAGVGLGSLPSVLEESFIRSRSVDTRITSPKEEESRESDDGDDQRRDQGRQNTREGIRATSTIAPLRLHSKVSG